MPLQPSATTLIAPEEAVSEIVLREIDERLDVLEDRWRIEQPDLSDLVSSLRTYVERGGKRLRPLFCAWGAVGAGADVTSDGVVDACAALELLHAFALIHDDVMDGSSTRRGHASLHVELEHRHARDGWNGEPRRTAEGLAVLVGDLAFVLADLFVEAAPRRVRDLWVELRLELVAGQWVDMMTTARGDRDAERSRWVARYKSGRYTVERPLHLGALVAGRPDLLAGYSLVGEPLGQAFQLRDDVMGVFGSSTVTGKPAGDDLREGKATTMLAIASERASHARDLALLDRVGSPDLTESEVVSLRDLIVETGALAQVECEIGRLADESLAAIDLLDLAGGAGDALRDLVERCAWRQA